METETLKDLAAQFAAAFETRTRVNGDTFICLKDGSPDWMTDIVYDAHDDMMPDDYRYRMISEVADSLNECDPDDWEDNMHEIVDGLVDIYNADRLAWLASHPNRAFYCDEAVSEGLVGDDTDMFTRIGIGQYKEYLEIYGTVAQDLRDLADDIE